MSNTRPRIIFVDMTGQEDNLGDVILRRSFLNALSIKGELHVLVGNHSSSYIRELSLAGATTYTRKRAWLARIITSARNNLCVYFEKPGEMQPQRWTIRNALPVLLAVALVKLFGGRAFCVGIGLRSPPRGKLATLLLRIILKQFDIVAWRDSVSFDITGIGSVMPDWAFGEPAVAGKTDMARNKLIVSLRDDRPFPSKAWIGGVRAWAEKRGLEIVTLWQVGRDRSKSQQLADCLRGQCANLESGDLQSWEHALRHLYSQAALVISDRLHVLIVAAIEGSIPICVTEWPEAKVERHFTAIGFSNVSHNVTGDAVREMDLLLDNQLKRREVLEAKVEQARNRVEELAQRAIGMAGG